MNANKRFAALLVGITAALSTLVTATAATPGVKQGDIVVLYTNDVHCALDENLGYAGLAAYRDEMKQLTEYVTLVDAGDATQGGTVGTLSKGIFPMQIMDKAGYAVAVPGNHEFDYGMENFQKIAATMKSSYTCCNFMDLKTGKPVFDAYKMVSYGDTQVAYVGITTPETFSSSTPVYFQDDTGKYIYGFCEGNDGKDLYQAVQRAVDAAKAAGADAVIAVGHCGVAEDSAPWRSTDIIANVSGLTAFLDGHSHSTIASQAVRDAEGKTVLLSSTGTKLSAIGKLVLRPDGTATTEVVTDYTVKDPDMTAFVKDIQSRNQALLDQVVGKTAVTLTTKNPDGSRAVRSGETNLGDFLADAFRAAGKADIGWINGGGIRADLDAGDITYGDILNVFPFGNELCVVKVTGQQILDMLEMAARSCPQETGAFMQVSGMRYTVDTSIPSTVTTDDKGAFTGITGARRVRDVQVGGGAIDPKKTYTLASIRYLIRDGGDGLNAFQNAPAVNAATLLDTQVVLDYLQKDCKGVIPADYAKAQGRITVTNQAAATPFPDVPADAWYYDAAVYVHANALFSGNSSGHFSPQGPMTRGQLVTVLWRMAGQPAAKGENPFVDVKDDSAFAKAIVWAAENDLTGGYADQTFQPNRPVSREQLAVFLYHYAKHMGYDTTQGGMALREYQDYASIGVYAVPALTWANSAGLIQGNEKTNSITPKAPATRAQVAVILQRFSTTVAK